MGSINKGRNLGNTGKESEIGNAKIYAVLRYSVAQLNLIFDSAYEYPNTPMFAQDLSSKTQ